MSKGKEIFLQNENRPSRTKVMTKNTNPKQLTCIDRHANVCYVDS